MRKFVTFAMLGGSAAFACAQGGVQGSVQGSVITHGLSAFSVIDPGAGQRACAGSCATGFGAGPGPESHIDVQRHAQAGNTEAIFAAESGVRVETGRGDRHERLQQRLYGHQAFVGLAGEFGAITIGRQYNLQYLALTDVGDPFKGGMAGNAGNLIAGGRRADNSVQYYGPLLRGISAGASYAFKNQVDTSPAGRAWGMTVGLEAGPLTVRAAHQNLNAVRVQLNSKTSNDTMARNSILAANLRLGWGTAYAAYSLSRGWAASPLFNPDNPYGAGLARTPSSSSRDGLFGLAMPLGQGTTLLASYITKDDRDLANQDATQVAFGASHAVSRRTDFYAAYSRIENRNGAGYTVGNGGARGNGNAALNLGMRHAF